jgi:nucleoid-associated protein YgaU
LSDSTIGIKVADGSYYPILEQGFRGRKRLVLTTVKDNQSKVQIDLYRGNGTALTKARYIGSLLIENIPPALQGLPEIELLIGVDERGQLSAEASDARTGESQKFTTSLKTLAAVDTYKEPEFSVERDALAEPDFEESPLTGESYRRGDAARREPDRQRRGPNVLLLVLAVILGIILVGAIAFFIYRAVQGPRVTSVPVVTQPAAKPAAPAPQAEPAPQPAAVEPAAPAAPAPAPVAAPETFYRIKQGDTLWDISATYYRNPWLYPRLARANSIRNPDLIFAGTRIVIPPN